MLSVPPIDVLVALGVAFLFFFSICCCIVRLCWLRWQTARKRRTAAPKEQRLIVDVDEHLVFQVQRQKRIQKRYMAEGKDIMPEVVQRHSHSDDSEHAMAMEGWMAMKRKQGASYKTRYYFLFSSERQRLWYKTSKEELCCAGTIDTEEIQKVQKVRTSSRHALVMTLMDKSHSPWFLSCDTESE